MGETREFPYSKMFDNITLSFYIDNNFEVKAFFDNWLNYISNTQNKITYYYKDYIAPTVLIEVLPMDSEVSMYSITLHEAYPKATSSIQLSADSRDVAKIGVNLNYKYYTTSHTNPKQFDIAQLTTTQPDLYETMLTVKDPDTNRFINELLGR
jgi:hypothetical protein